MITPNSFLIPRYQISPQLLQGHTIALKYSQWDEELFISFQLEPSIDALWLNYLCDILVALPFRTCHGMRWSLSSKLLPAHFPNTHWFIFLGNIQTPRRTQSLRGWTLDLDWLDYTTTHYLDRFTKFLYSLVFILKIGWNLQNMVSKIIKWDNICKALFRVLFPSD